jgi:ADP-heptose:LPS heptosyltransferase
MSAATETENILLIRLKSIGDIVFALPAVHVVRESFPNAKITFLVSREHASLIEGFREVNQAITLDRALYRRWNPKGIVLETLSLLHRLRREKFSLVLDFQGYGETALLTWWTRARRRWSSVYQPARGWAYTQSVRRDPHLHPVDWHLSLLQQCGLRAGPVRNEFILPDAALGEARRLYAAQGLDPARAALFIQPFTSSPKKDWPLENYLALAHHWQERGVQVLFSGGPAERAALEPVRQAGFPVFAGAPLLVAGGLMQLSTLIVGGDTGLLHLAVALGKRVLMLIKRGGPGATIPYQHADWIVEPPAGLLLKQIELGPVLQATGRAFGECRR